MNRYLKHQCLAMSIFLLFSSGVWAQGMNDSVPKEEPAVAQEMLLMQGQMLGVAQEQGMGGGCPMKDKMMRLRGGSEMVATSDGGVVILQGRKLLKYDKNLNLVKEVELKFENDGMPMMQGEKKCSCPHCLGMKKHGKQEEAQGK